MAVLGRLWVPLVSPVRVGQPCSGTRPVRGPSGEEQRRVRRLRRRPGDTFGRLRERGGPRRLTNADTVEALNENKDFVNHSKQDKDWF